MIPTYNRPLELERTFEYWRDTPITVHIVDGSEKPWFEIGSLQNIPTITYNHLPAKPGEANLDNYARRLRFANHCQSQNIRRYVQMMFLLFLDYSEN